MNRTSRVPSYRRHKATGQAIVVLGGRTIYLGRFGSIESRARYNRELAEWLTQGGSALPAVAVSASGPGATLTVAELILDYWRYAQDYYRKNDQPTSQVDQIKQSLGPLRRLYGDTPAREFGPLALKAVRQSFIDSGFCRAEVNRKTQKIVRMFKWAVSNEKVPASVHHGLKAVDGLKRGRCEAREAPPIKPVPDAFVNAVEPFVSRQVWAMIQLQRLTGMRPGEVCMMRTTDINATGSIWEYRPESHKTEHHGKDRIIHLGPQARAILGPWLKTELAAYLFSPKESMEACAVELRKARKSGVQPSQQNRRKRRPKRVPADKYRVTGYALAIRRGCDRAFPHPTLEDVPAQELTEEQRAELRAWRKAHRWAPNQLRHNAATRIRRECGLDVAKAVLGHSSVVPTQVYAEQDMEAARRAMEKFG